MSGSRLLRARNGGRAAKKCSWNVSGVHLGGQLLLLLLWTGGLSSSRLKTAQLLSSRRGIKPQICFLKILSRVAYFGPVLFNVLLGR